MNAADWAELERLAARLEALRHRARAEGMVNQGVGAVSTRVEIAETEAQRERILQRLYQAVPELVA